MSLKKYSFWTIFIYGLALFSPMMFRTLNLFQSGNQSVQAMTVAYILGALMLLALYFKGNKLLDIEKRDTSIWTILGMGIIGIFLAIMLQSILTQIEAAITDTEITSQNTQNILSLLDASPFFILAVSIGGPIMEELVYRRALLGMIANYSNYWVGAIVSSIIFAFAHSDGHLLIYSALGFFLALLYRFTGSIWTSMITHIGMNTVVILIQVLLAGG